MIQLEIATFRFVYVYILLTDWICSCCFFSQNVYAPEPDPEMTVIHYQRTFEQNELLGLTEMKTEDYV